MKSWPGYIVAYSLESVGGYAACLASVNFLCVFIGSCWVLTAMVKDITNELHELNVGKSGNASQTEIHWQLCSISKRLSDAKQFSKMTSIGYI